MNPDGTVSISEDEPLCAICGVSAVIPGTSYCGACSTSWPDGGGENGGPDGSFSDGTNPSADPNVGGWVDGTLREDDMTVEEIRLSAYLAEVRTKYTDQQLRELGKSGKAIRNADGSYSFPIADLQDAVNAAHAVQFSGESADAVRSFIIQVSKEVGFSVPADWAEDGSIKTEEERDSAVDVIVPVGTEITDDAVAEEEAEAEASEEDEERSEEEATAEQRSVRKPRTRSATPSPREELRLSQIHFGVNDLKITEMRAGGSTLGITLEGTPIVYNRSYSVHDMLGTFRETMAPSVCEGVLASPQRLDCRFLFNHDGLPLARTQAGTLELVNTRDGLRSIAQLDTRQTLANDLAVAIERGDVSQMSCGFIVGEDHWSDDYSERTIVRISELLDVSAVTYPASPTTEIMIQQRMIQAVPIESRARLRETFKIVNECRAGRTLNKENATIILSAIEALHNADELDPASFAERAAGLVAAHQQASEALRSVQGLELEPAADNADEPGGAVNDPGESMRSADETAELRRKVILARRERLARKRFLS